MPTGTEWTGAKRRGMKWKEEETLCNVVNWIKRIGKVLLKTSERSEARERIEEESRNLLPERSGGILENLSMTIRETVKSTGAKFPKGMSGREKLSNRIKIGNSSIFWRKGGEKEISSLQELFQYIRGMTVTLYVPLRLWVNPESRIQCDGPSFCSRFALQKESPGTESYSICL